MYQGDNMLWHVRPARPAPAVELSIYNAGIGWISILLSRAQIEDMLQAMALALRDLPGMAEAKPEVAPPSSHAERTVVQPT